MSCDFPARYDSLCAEVLAWGTQGARCCSGCALGAQALRATEKRAVDFHSPPPIDGAAAEPKSPSARRSRRGSRGAGGDRPARLRTRVSPRRAALSRAGRTQRSGIDCPVPGSARSQYRGDARFRSRAPRSAPPRQPPDGRSRAAGARRFRGRDVFSSWQYLVSLVPADGTGLRPPRPRKVARSVATWRAAESALDLAAAARYSSPSLGGVAASVASAALTAGSRAASRPM